MERFIQLNLRNDHAKAETVNASKLAIQSPAVTGKTNNLMANKFAHKIARNFARNSSGIFTK